MSTAPVQIAMYLPPPITPANAASILGKLGGEARARQIRERFRRKALQLRNELHLGEHPGLRAG